MEYKDIIKRVEPEMDKAISYLDSELAKMRTSRVSPQLVEDIQVDMFGKLLALKELSVISISDARQLTVQPWDKTYVEAIEKAIQSSGISGSAVVDGDVIRVTFPPLSEEYRKDVIKKVHELAEEVRQSVRKWREKAWDEIQDKERSGDIREDDKFRGKDELQKLIDDYNKKVETAVEKKEKEVLS